MQSWLARYILVSFLLTARLSPRKTKNISVRNRVLMAIGARNVKKFVLAPKMVQNVITFLVNVNVVLVIMAITVMNYAPLGPLEVAAQRFASAGLGQMTVIQLTAVASVSQDTPDLCATKVKIIMHQYKI